MPITAATISLKQTLDLLDGRFNDFQVGFNRGEYALWLGSGISRDRVAALDGVLSKLIEFLRVRVSALANCKYRIALNQVIDFASLTPEQRAAIDFALPVSAWPGASNILWRLSERYSDVLNVTVAGEAADFLLWDAVDFRATFANEHPDAEHLCVAVLSAEGVITDIVSANWDGLLEAAVRELGFPIELYRICVTGADFRGPATGARVLKFHGCAVRAIADEARYRPLLIARAPQIVAWGHDHNFTAIRNELAAAASQKRTLMVGMSAQDTNIQALFQEARNHAAWPWSDNPSPHIFAEDAIRPGQRNILQIAYGNDYSPNEPAILERSVLKAFGKPLFAALVLTALSTKLCALMRLAQAPNLTDADHKSLDRGILKIRDLVAENAPGDRARFIRDLIRHFSRLKAILQDGVNQTDACVRYRPISLHPSHQMANDPNIATTGQREAAQGLALVGLGVIATDWEVSLEGIDDDNCGALRITSPAGTARVIFVANDNVALQLFQAGHYREDEGDAILVHSASIMAAKSRSPSRPLGRTGRAKATHVDMSQLLRVSVDLTDLRERFRQGVGL